MQYLSLPIVLPVHLDSRSKEAHLLDLVATINKLGLHYTAAVPSVLSTVNWQAFNGHGVHCGHCTYMVCALVYIIYTGISPLNVTVSVCMFSHIVLIETMP